MAAMIPSRSTAPTPLRIPTSAAVLRPPSELTLPVKDRGLEIADTPIESRCAELNDCNATVFWVVLRIILIVACPVAASNEVTAMSCDGIPVALARACTSESGVKIVC